MTPEELSAALDRHSAKIQNMLVEVAKALTASAETAASAQLEAQRMSGETNLELQRMADAGPRARMRDNLAANCYQIRLRAQVERPESQPILFYSEQLTENAVRDADGLLAALDAPVEQTSEELKLSLRSVCDRLRGRSLTAHEVDAMNAVVEAEYARLFDVIEECGSMNPKEST